MTDQRIPSLGDDLAGQTNGSGFSGALGERRRQAGEALTQAKDGYLGVYGQAMDKLEGLIPHAPEGVQETARTTIAAARKRPLLTTAIVAGLGLLLLRGGRRR
jgi:hypothetical protein